MLGFRIGLLSQGICNLLAIQLTLFFIKVSHYPSHRHTCLKAEVKPFPFEKWSTCGLQVCSFNTPVTLQGKSSEGKTCDYHLAEVSPPGFSLDYPNMNADPTSLKSTVSETMETTGIIPSN